MIYLVMAYLIGFVASIPYEGKYCKKERLT